MICSSHVLCSYVYSHVSTIPIIYHFIVGTAVLSLVLVFRSQAHHDSGLSTPSYCLFISFSRHCGTPAPIMLFYFSLLDYTQDCTRKNEMHVSGNEKIKSPVCQSTKYFKPKNRVRPRYIMLFSLKAWLPCVCCVLFLGKIVLRPQPTHPNPIYELY